MPTFYLDKYSEGKHIASLRFVPDTSVVNNEPAKETYVFDWNEFLTNETMQPKRKPGHAFVIACHNSSDKMEMS